MLLLSQNNFQLSALSTLLCLPHFFEFLIDKEGDDIYEDFYKGSQNFSKKSEFFFVGANFYYRLIYFSIIDPFFR